MIRPLKYTAVAFLQLLFLDYLLLFLCVVVFEHKSFGNALSAGSRQFGRTDEVAGGMLDEDVGNAGRAKEVGTVRREVEVETGPDSRWTLSEYCRESGRMVDAGRFSAMAVVGENLLVYNRNSFQRDTVVGAWKRCWET